MRDGPPTLFSRIKKSLAPTERLGERLCREGLISRKHLRQALELQEKNGFRLGHTLIRMGVLEERRLIEFLADRYRIPCISIESGMIEDSAVGLLSPEQMERTRAIPISATTQTVTLAMVDPTDQTAVEEIEAELELKANPVATPESAFLKTLGELTTEGDFTEILTKIEPEQRSELLKLFRRLSDYEWLEIIAEGGFAKVFKCIQKSLDRPVAIKTLDLRKIPYESVIQQFQSEGRIIAKLDHLNIVRVIEQGQVGDILYVVMEYVEGLTLNRYLKGADLKTAIDVFIQVCDALAYAHERGILHRDIKPGNILVDRNRMAKLLDFGIARLLDPTGVRSKQEESLILGTPKYMSPEQDSGAADIDDRADLYSLGVVMFEAFTRSEAKAIPEIDPCSLNPDLPPPLGRAIQKCLMPKREDRIRNASTLMQFLIQLRDSLFEPDKAIAETFEGIVTDDKKDLFEEHYEFLSVLTDNALCRTQIAEHRGMRRMLVIREVKNTEMLPVAKMRSKIEHEHIAEVLGLGEGQGHYVVIREFLAGGSLGDRIKHPARIKEDQAIRYMRAMVQGLHEAAGFKVPHGHLHPENILFDREGTLKIADFGVPFSGDPKLKRFFEKGPKDPFSHDRFSLGTIFFEMIAGRQYFPGQGPEGNIRHLETVDLDPAGIKMVIRRLWGLVPAEDRYTDYQEVLKDLDGLPKPSGGSKKVKSVFDLQETSHPGRPTDGTPPVEKPKKKSDAPPADEPVFNPFQRVLLILIVLILGGVGWFIYQAYFSGP